MNFYDPTEEEPKWQPSEVFTKFLLTNFDRKLSQSQIDTVLEECQPPDLKDPCWAPKLGQDVTKQILFEAKKIRPRRDQDLYIIQKHMLAATGPLLLKNGECAKEQTLRLLEKSLCLLGSASTGLTTLHRTKVLAYIKKIKFILLSNHILMPVGYCSGKISETMRKKKVRHL